MRIILYAIILISITQLIYLYESDIPFYYKEIWYQWNYITTKTTKFNNVDQWVCNLYKGYELLNDVPVKVNQIQTDTYSYQQKTNVHIHTSSIIVLIIMILILYVVNVSTNTILYQHEKKKTIQFLTICVIVLFFFVFIYNTEYLSTVLFKNTFFYTDNIYLKNEKEQAGTGPMFLYIITVVYYIHQLKNNETKAVSKYILITLPLIVNLYQENIIIGYEYCYFYIYIEFIFLIISILINQKRTNGRVVKGTCLEHKEP